MPTTYRDAHPQHNPHSLWPPAPDLRRATLSFEFRGHTYSGELVAPGPEVGQRPLVLVIHNYQGMKFFDVDVAEYLARVGYVGLAIDLYGDRVPANQREFPNDPEQVAEFQKRCFEGMVAMDHDHEHFRSLLEEWLQQGLAQDSVDSVLAPAAIGYCFGGMAVLECVRGGLNVSGVVSFHGLLQTGEDPNPALNGAERPPLKPAPNDYTKGAVVVIENGADDHLVPDASKARFFAEMDAAGVEWVFNHHSRTPHGFALPPTLGPPGHLHEATDRRSTVSMLALFRELFPGVSQDHVAHNACGTVIPA